MSTQSGIITALEHCPKCTGALLAASRVFIGANPAVMSLWTAQESSNCSQVKIHKFATLEERSESRAGSPRAHAHEVLSTAMASAYDDMYWHVWFCCFATIQKTLPWLAWLGLRRWAPVNCYAREWIIGGA